MERERASNWDWSPRSTRSRFITQYSSKGETTVWGKGWSRFVVMDFNTNHCDSSKGKDTLIQLLSSLFLINRRFFNVLPPAIYLLKLDQRGLAKLNRFYQVLKCQTNIDRNTKQIQAKDGWMDYRMEGAPNWDWLRSPPLGHPSILESLSIRSSTKNSILKISNIFGYFWLFCVQVNSTQFGFLETLGLSLCICDQSNQG